MARAIEQQAAFQAAQRLESEGKAVEAFRAYLAIAGAEHLAVRLARSDPARFLVIAKDVTDRADALPSPGALCVRADLLLATGAKEEALTAYRSAAAALPTDYYPVDPAPVPASQRDYGYSHQGMLMQFTIGPGSHRDNWLIRRFIALEAWDDAGKEFGRIATLYQKHAEADGRALRQYSSMGLQFAIDYAFFLDRQKKTPDALALLRDVLLRIDLDHQANRDMGRQFYFSQGGPAGLSRKEFIRLAYGQFKAVSREPDLLQAIQAKIDAGHNPARRLMARVLLYQQKPDEAMAMELKYIEMGSFDALTASWRRGMIYEDFKKLPEAVGEYEEAIALAPHRPNLPDPDEESSRSFLTQQILQFRPAARDADDLTSFRIDLLGRLHRLYAALGRTEKLMEVSLRELEQGDAILENAAAIEQAALTFRSAGQEKKFADWAQKRAAGVKSPSARANLFWASHDVPATTAALAELAKTNPSFRSSSFETWRQRFADLGKPQLQTFLAAIVEADPKNAAAQLAILDLDGRKDAKSAIVALELMLDSDAAPTFMRSPADTSAKFRNYYDLAYQLMRQYEKQDQLGKLQALGVRIARGDKPFGNLPRDLEQFAYRDWDDVPEFATAALSLAIAHAADAKTQDELAAALEKSPWQGARRQLERLRAGGIKAPKDLKPFGWANLPQGVQLLAANENVLSLCRDEHYLYAGHPWGVAVYDLHGKPVTRVALEDAALHLAVMGDALWVGTPTGLDRVDVKTWAAAHMSCDQDLDERERRDAERKDFYNGVCGLASDGKLLWIGTRRNVRTYNPATNELRIFSQEELGYDSHADWTRFVFDGDLVWAVGDAGCSRYDRTANRWDIPTFSGDHAVRLIGLVDGNVWGQVWLNDALRARPALIDRKTLAVTPIMIDAGLSRSELCLNGPWSFYGRCQGKLVFGTGGPAYVFDAESRKLKPIPAGPGGSAIAIDSEIPPGLRSGSPVWEVGAIACTDDHTHRHNVFGEPFHASMWDMLKLPDGSWVLGGSHSRTPRYIYPREDWPFGDMVYETPDGSGGLHILNAGARTHISAGFSDTLLGDTVFAVVSEGQRTWVCTSYGLAALDPEARIVSTLTGRDGLLGNRISGGAVLGSKVYFATRHDDRCGGLVIFDPATSLFSAMLESDGLATGALEGVQADGDKLGLTYGVSYRRYGNFSYEQYAPGKYTPATGAFSPRNAPKILDQSAANAAASRPRLGGDMPFLGGSIISRQSIGGKTFVCGTRGLVVLSPGATAALNMPALNPKLAPGQDILLRREAVGLKIAAPLQADALREYLKSPNPYIVAEALAAAYEPMAKGGKEFTPLVASCIKHPSLRVRSTAMVLLSASGDEAVIPPLRTLMDDPSPLIRAHAALALARRGQDVSAASFEDILRRRSGFGNPLYGATSNWGQVADAQRTYEVLAPRATPEIFALLLHYPPYISNYDNKKTVFPQLGASLRRHPEVIPTLLKANETQANGVRNSDFTVGVLGCAGKDVLPALYEALKSPDRVVRANAARGCGAIGDATAIPSLIAALDLESGLSRAGIVWALGELKAVDAVPHLAHLYVDARNDDRRRAGSGFRMSQAAAVMQDQYNSLRSMDAIGGEWNELKEAARPQPLAPAGNEPLLTPALVLEAVRKIGPQVAQDFYRALAGESDVEGRLEAAQQLAAGTGPQRERNLPILKNLLSDADLSVRLAAAVSLILLDQEAGRAPILAALTSNEPWMKTQALSELVRAKGRLGFAYKELGDCAHDPALDDSWHRRAQLLTSP